MPYLIGKIREWGKVKQKQKKKKKTNGALDLKHSIVTLILV